MPSIARQRRRVGGVIVHAEQLVGHEIGLFALRTVADDAHRRAPEILDQHDAQRDGHGPELTDGQRLHVLIGAHEAAEQVGIEAAVGVRHEGPGDAEDAWISDEGAFAQLR